LYAGDDINMMAYERRYGKILSGVQPLGIGVWTIELGSVKKIPF
jgi:hypothetical protein